MNSRHDLTGRLIGKLTVLERAERPTTVKRGAVYWLCKCTCGRNKVVSADYLRRCKIEPSCGCVAREHLRLGASRLIIDLVGRRFGRLIVEKIDTKRSQRGARWW